MPTVGFNFVEEFCEELEKDALKGLVDRSIVRVTNLFRQSKLSVNIHHVCVVSTYSVGGEVVRLERYCGDIWRINEERDNEVLQRAGMVQLAIAAACDRLGLELRAGRLEGDDV